jgi:hypothetical protein
MNKNMLSAVVIALALTGCSSKETASREPSSSKNSDSEVIKTSSGAVYTRSNEFPELGEAWRDPRGLVWSDVPVDADGGQVLMTFQKAQDFCSAVNARLPSYREVLDLIADSGGRKVTVDVDNRGSYEMPQSDFLEYSVDSKHATYIETKHFSFQVLAHFRAPNKYRLDPRIMTYEGPGRGLCEFVRMDAAPFSDALPLFGVHSATVRCFTLQSESVDGADRTDRYSPRCVRKSHSSR